MKYQAYIILNLDAQYDSDNYSVKIYDGMGPDRTVKLCATRAIAEDHANTLNAFLRITQQYTKISEDR